MSHLRYVPGTRYGDNFPNVRYPLDHEVSREQAERMRQAMPTPDAFEIVEEGT